MLIHILALLFFGGRSWADSFQPILTHISTGNSYCNSDVLLGDFDLKAVPQFNALCNIPIPDIQQSEFLLENNVVPILCMGLLDVTLRLCKSAKNDVSQFEDIFPPTTVKFNNIFVELSKSNDFSVLDEFCSSTVHKFEIKNATSNVTELWWQVLNKQLDDEKLCSAICRSNEGNKVHPLCSYILWSNGVYINYQKNQAEVQVTAVGEDQNRENANEEGTDQAGESVQVGFVKNEQVTKPTDTVSGPDLVPASGNTTQLAEGAKSNLTIDNNVVGVGTVEQVLNNGGQLPVTDTVKTDVNPSADKGKLAKKSEKLKIKHHNIKEAAKISNISGSLSAGVGTIVLDKSVSSVGQTEIKTEPKASAMAVSSHSEPQGKAEGGPIVPEPQEQGEAKQGSELGKVGEGMVEGDFSLEVTPDGIGLDNPIADKDLQPPYSDEEGEDGDGDDVETPVESNVQVNTNTVSSSSRPSVSKISNPGVASIQQRPLEGDKVYGEGEILIEDHFIEAEDSHFFTYFLCMAVLTIMAYLAFHNKKKLIALAVEGRRTKGGRRRPNSSHYSKLDCSLEEALVSNTTASVTQVLY